MTTCLTLCAAPHMAHTNRACRQSPDGKSTKTNTAGPCLLLLLLRLKHAALKALHDNVIGHSARCVHCDCGGGLCAGIEAKRRCTTGRKPSNFVSNCEPTSFNQRGLSSQQCREYHTNHHLLLSPPLLLSCCCLLLLQLLPICRFEAAARPWNPQFLIAYCGSKIKRAPTCGVSHMSLSVQLIVEEGRGRSRFTRRQK